MKTSLHKHTCANFMKCSMGFYTTNSEQYSIFIQLSFIGCCTLFQPQWVKWLLLQQLLLVFTKKDWNEIKFSASSLHYYYVLLSTPSLQQPRKRLCAIFPLRPVLVLFLVSYIKFTTYWFSFHFAVVAFVGWSFDTIKPFDNPVKTTFEWKSVVWQIFSAPLHSPQMTFGF